MRAKVGFVLLYAVALVGCAAGGFNSAQRTAQLSPGMSYQEVVALLGEPSASASQNGRRTVTFWLHEAWRGNVPYDLVFTGQPERLDSWGENEAEYAASQERLGEVAQALEQIAGRWWGYAGSTERTLGLCADGTYYTSRESSYSGTSSDAGGNEVMAWGAASRGNGEGRWTISGSAQSGSIHVQNSDGGSGNITYQSINDPGCLSIDGNTMCRSSAECR